MTESEPEARITTRVDSDSPVVTPVQANTWLEIIEMSRGPQGPPGNANDGLIAILDARVDRLEQQIADLLDLSQGDGDVYRMTFDDGTEGGLMTAGGVVYAVVGNVRYKAAASKYTSGLGLALNGPAGDWGNFSVVTPNATASDWQIYVRVHTIGKGPLDLGTFQNLVLGGHVDLGSLILKTGRQIGLRPPELLEDVTGVSTDAKFPLDAWFRLDMRIEQLGDNVKLLVQAFWTDPEGTIADAAMSTSYPSATIDKIKWGSGSADASWNLDLETLSIKAGTDKLIPPFSPGLPVWLHEYEALNDRTMAVGDLGMEDAVQAVGCQALVAAAKHGTRGLRTTNGYVEYPIRNLGGQTASAYFNRRSAGTNQSAIVGWMAGAVQVAAIRVRTGPGGLTIVDQAGTVKVTSIQGIATGIWFRMDWSHTWTSAGGGTLTINARINWPTAEAGEGTTYDSFSTVITGVAQPATTRIGFQDNSGGTWVGDVDSHRSNSNLTDLTIWGPVTPAAVPTYSYVLGGLTGATTGEIKALVPGYTSINLGWSTTKAADGTPTGTITYLGAKTPDANGLVKWTVTGLSPGVPRYFKLNSDGATGWLGDAVIITPRPASGTAFSNWRIAYMSCQRSQNVGTAGGTPYVEGQGYYEPVWTDSLAWGAQEIWFTGDMGYWGSNNRPSDTPWTMSQRFNLWLATMPKMRAAFASAPTRWMKDDHEVGPNDLDSSTDPGKSAVEKLHNTELGMPAIFPMYPLKAATQTDSYGTYRRSLFGWEMFTSRIRIVYLDTYSMERSPWATADQAGAGFGSASNGTEKTWLGVEQDKLLEALLTTGTQPPLTIFVCPKTFLGRVSGAYVENDYDKIWIYNAWRTWFGNMVKTLPGAVWLGGDRHYNAYAPASMNPWCPMPCYISSPTAMHNLRSTDKEMANTGKIPGITEGYTKLDPLSMIDADPSKNYQRSLMTYIRFTLSDDNAGHITLTSRSRYHPNDWDGVTDPNATKDDQGHWIKEPNEMWLWPDWMDDPLVDGFTATDTWTYTP